jgi:DNA-binding LacI/PurR family transcriptional regulator
MRCGPCAEAAAGCPTDVAVIGFEDSPLARHTDSKLTPWPAGGGHGRVAGERTARLDPAGLPGPRARGVDTELVIREST